MSEKNVAAQSNYCKLNSENDTLVAGPLPPQKPGELPVNFIPANIFPSKPTVKFQSHHMWT
ncbi:predicted protein [Botrytis cinerea T4]|uniref:Uncharacterized protein n=1 Tax=Botryotinia fuckeliana (strain T4) TaxID=999810 RepID=G2XXK7_BOTF4|nr:predicted protein [Botrytis cinerea T4]